MRNKALAVPYVVWMAIFVIAPLVLIVAYAFTAKSGGVTLDNFSNMGQYLPAFQHSFVLAGAATLICILIGYPLAYFLSKESLMVRKVAMMLNMHPMGKNLHLRTNPWMSLLDDNGLINQALGSLGVFQWINGVFGTNISYIHMINTRGAIVLGMVYNFLPFMIMPVFSVIDKIDPKVIEAAQDLGADSMMVFRKVVFPLSLPGVLSGVTMVFIPAVSTFALSRLLGGGKTLLLGDLIEMQFLGNAYNPHLGSAIALVMMVIVLLCMAIMNRFGEGDEGVAVL